MSAEEQQDAPQETPQTKAGKEIQEKIEDILRLWLNNESIDDILPVVDQLFDTIPTADWPNVLSFLPPRLCTQCFLRFLEKHPTTKGDDNSTNASDTAKQFIPIVDNMKFDESNSPKRSKVYLQMYTLLNGNHVEEAHRFLVKYLSTFNKVDDTADVESHACEAILNCLKLPIWEYDEVMDLVPVRGLRTSKNADSKLLLQLWEIFCHNGVNEWTNFHNDNKALIEDTWGLDQSTLSEKIRLLTLCRMAHNNSRELSFSTIAGGLSINEEEVESVVIRAVANKLMEARVDQVDKTVTVTYSHHSLFSTEQWRQLQETLGTWKESVAGLTNKLETMQK